MFFIEKRIGQVQSTPKVTSKMVRKKREQQNNGNRNAQEVE